MSNGEATKTSRNAKKLATAARTGTVHGTTSRVRRGLSARAADDAPTRTSSHRRSDPSCPDQSAESEYPSGSSRLVWPAT